MRPDRRRPRRAAVRPGRTLPRARARPSSEGRRTRGQARSPPERMSRSASIAARSPLRPRRSRPFTVPSGTPVRSAISVCVRPLKYASSIASRWTLEMDVERRDDGVPVEPLLDLRPRVGQGQGVRERRLVVRELGRGPPAADRVDRPVMDDREQPRADRAARVDVPRGVPPSAQERFLDDVLGSRSVARDSKRNREGHRSVVFVQLSERPEVAVRESVHRVPIGPILIRPGHASSDDLRIAHRSLRRTAAHGSLSSIRGPRAVARRECIEVSSRLDWIVSGEFALNVRNGGRRPGIGTARAGRPGRRCFARWVAVSDRPSRGGRAHTPGSGSARRGRC